MKEQKQKSELRTGIMVVPCVNDTVTPKLLQSIANYIGTRNLGEANDFDNCPVIIFKDNVQLSKQDQKYIKELCTNENCAAFRISYLDDILDYTVEKLGLPRFVIS